GAACPSGVGARDCGTGVLGGARKDAASTACRRSDAGDGSAVGAAAAATPLAAAAGAGPGAQAE
ncbi:MAG: hypothetical protein ACK4YT_13840, partial [Sphingomonas sp.]